MAAWAASAGLSRPPVDDAPVLAFASYRPSVRIRLSSPTDGLTLVRDPETPSALATLSLGAIVDPPGAEVVFYVDGRPYETVGYPYRARWTLQPGAHVFEARVPAAGVTSAKVRVLVQ
jgi:hypothetical protein